MKRVAISLVVDGNKVHHEHVVAERIQTKDPDLERREHSSEEIGKNIKMNIRLRKGIDLLYGDILCILRI